MKLRLLPPLWIVRLPLVSVGLLPHPALGVPAAAAAASALGDVVAPALGVVPPTARTSSAAAATDLNNDLYLDIRKPLWPVFRDCVRFRCGRALASRRRVAAGEDSATATRRRVAHVGQDARASRRRVVVVAPAMTATRRRVAVGQRSRITRR